MTQSSVAVTEVPRFQFGIAARLAVIAIVFLAEKMLLNTLIDFHRPLAMLGLDGFAQMVHYRRMPFVVVLAAAAALFAYLRCRWAATNGIWPAATGAGRLRERRHRRTAPTFLMCYSARTVFFSWIHKWDARRVHTEAPTATLIIRFELLPATSASSRSVSRQAVRRHAESRAGPR